MKKIILSIILIFGLALLNSLYAISPTVTYNEDGTGNFTYDYGINVKVNQYFCKNTDNFIKEGHGASDDGKDWHGTTMMYGTWTSWWKGVSKYCMKKGLWSSSNAESMSDKWEWKAFSFTIKGETSFKGELLGYKNYDSITIKGTKEEIGGETITSPTFNSPFIYFKNAPEGKFSVELNSKFDNYKSIPKLNKNNSWEGIIKNDKFVIDNKENTNLFYELELNKIILNRNGKNFNSKEELINYLTKSDFFEKMGFTKKQKENSLNYLLPKIKESPNYYLTILNNNSIENISNLKFSKQPEEFVRKFFAIYPTKTKVKTNGDLEFPILKNDTSKFKVIETGEILVSDNMFVFWEK